MQHVANHSTYHRGQVVTLLRSLGARGRHRHGGLGPGAGRAHRRASPDVRVPAPLDLSREGRLLFAGRALRTFGFGWLSLVLALYLERRGLSAPAIGAVFTATLVEDAVFTVLVAGPRAARRAGGASCSARRS